MGEVRPGLHVGCQLPLHSIGCPDYREDGKDWPTVPEVPREPGSDRA